MTRKLARKGTGGLILAALLLSPMAPVGSSAIASADSGVVAPAGWLDWAVRWAEEVWAWWSGVPAEGPSEPVLEKQHFPGHHPPPGNGNSTDGCSGYTSDPDGCPGT